MTGVERLGGHGWLLRRYVVPRWRQVAWVGVLLVSTVGLQTAHPRLLAAFIDRAGRGAPLDVLTRIGVATIVVAILRQVTAVADTYAAEHLAQVTTNQLRADLTAHVIDLDASFHGAHRPGELVQRVEGDTGRLANLLSRFVVALGANALLVIAVTVVLALEDWRLGLELLLAAATMPVLAWGFARTARRSTAAWLEAQADQTGFLEEHLSATEDLRSCGAAAHMMRQLTLHDRVVLRRRLRAWVLGNLGGNAGAAAFGLASVGMLATALWLLRRGEATVGAVFLVFAYTRALADPIQAISRELQDLQAAAAAAIRVTELLETRSRLEDVGTTPLPAGALAVELAHVDFAYPDAPHVAVLHDVTLRVDAGRSLGVVGRTGSGKTTIGRLVARLQDVEAGRVTLGGVDVRDTPLHELRRRVCLVSQEVQLFHASARENLTLFDPTVPDDRIHAVLADLGLDLWLGTLPKGLDAPLATSDVSAGEAQLLAFARAFLRRPDVVVLDEATARLDPASQQRVGHATSELLAGRTSIVIAHRLATLHSVDDIAVVERGRVVEHGPREVLAADPHSRYHHLLANDREVSA